MWSFLFSIKTTKKPLNESAVYLVNLQDYLATYPGTKISRMRSNVECSIPKDSK